jgi:hypothetical protein
MTYYNPDKDILFDEAVMSEEVLKIVDLICRAAWEIKSSNRNPFRIDGKEVHLNHPKSEYTFFQALWASCPEINLRLRPNEKGLDLSGVHIAALMYGMRQNFYNKLVGGKTHVGWYLPPDEVLLACLPGVFDDFQETFARDGPLGLQSRGNDFLGRIAITFSQYVQRNFSATRGQYLDKVVG